MSAQPLTNEDVREMFRETDRLMKEQAAEFDRRMKETDRRMKESDRRMKESDRRMKESDRRMKESDREFRRTRQLMKEQAAEYAREKKERDTVYEREKKERDAELARIEKETNRRIGNLTGRIGMMVEHMIGGRILEKFQALGYAVDDCTRNHSYRNSKLGISGEIDLLLQDGDVAILIEVKTTLETADVRKHLEQIEKYRRHADAAKILWPPTTRFIGAVAGAIVEDEAMKFAHENGMYVIVQSGEAVEIMQTPEGFKAKEW